MNRVVKATVKATMTGIFNFVTNRLFLLLLIVIGLFYTLVQAVFQLTIVQGEQLANEFELSVIRDVSTEGQRGNIYDRNGVPLATNKTAYNVLLNDSIDVTDKNAMINEVVHIIKRNGDTIVSDLPFKVTREGIDFLGTDSEIQEFKKNIFSRRKLKKEQMAMSTFEVCRYMQEKLFQIPPTYTQEETLDICIVRYAQYIKRFSKYRPEIIAYNISTETLASLEEKRDVFPGITIEESTYRIYNDAPYFAHIIGYTRQINSEKLKVMQPLGYDSNDTIGVMGIEKELEPYLRGYDGYQKVEVNNLGKTMLVLEDIEPMIGHDVYLTIDHALQIKTYNILEQEMAKILVDKLYMAYPRVKNAQFILLKDVYEAIFKRKLIDIELFDFTASESQKKIISIMERKSEAIATEILEEVAEGKPVYDKDMSIPVYTYLFTRLEHDGYIEGDYKKNNSYTSFKEGMLSFNSFLELLNADIDINILSPTETENVLEEITTVKVQEYLSDSAFREYVYLDLIEEEVLSYLDLTMLIIEQGLVHATEEEIKALRKRKLSPIKFMKEKLLNIEITPQELALDPSSGSIVITDVDTGEILAMVSYPTYDNSRLVNQFDNAYYAKLLADDTSPLYPRATFSKSAPASTFKMITAMAVLEEGIITPNTIVNTTGYFDKIHPAAKCWIYSYGGRHGHINVSDAIEESCNYFFYEMGYRLSLDEEGRYVDSQGLSILEEYASRFGLDSKTGIEIAEASSHLPTRDAVRASIGQVDHNYTPIQLARYMNTLVNDGQMKELNLVDKVTTKTGQLVEDFSAEIVRENTFDLANLKVVKDAMLAVTEGKKGTARRYFEDLPVSVAGKTGTAQLYKTRANHSIFAGFVPFEAPTISVVTVIQFGYASKYAAITSERIINMYFDFDSTIEAYTLDHMLE